MPHIWTTDHRYAMLLSLLKAEILLSMWTKEKAKAYKDAWKLSPAGLASKERTKAKRGLDVERERRSLLRRGGGLFTAELVEQLRELQRGLCALCYVKLTHGKCSHSSECWDHCHESLIPRGLLCSTCNFSLGNYERFQAPRGMHIAIYERYLERPPALLVDGDVLLRWL